MAISQVTGEDMKKVKPAIEFLISSRAFTTQVAIADALSVSQSVLSRWITGGVGMRKKTFNRLMDIKRQVEETGKYTPPQSVVACRDVVSGNATVNNADASTMWKDYQSRMINAVLKSDLPFDVQTRVISIIVNA